MKASKVGNFCPVPRPPISMPSCGVFVETITLLHETEYEFNEASEIESSVIDTVQTSFGAGGNWSRATHATLSLFPRDKVFTPATRVGLPGKPRKNPRGGNSSNATSGTKASSWKWWR